MGRPKGSKNVKPSTKLLINCLQCGGEMAVYRCRLPAKQFCSRKCLAEFQSRPGWGGRPRLDTPKIHPSGYALVYVGRIGQGRTGRSIYRPEHRVVMEEVLGRKLLNTEFVHHLNGVKTDNRPGNLEVWIRRHPAGQRLPEAARHCATCTCPIGANHALPSVL
jgi:hypothetical protein